MSKGGLLYRIQQKLRYHLSSESLIKLIAEINRYEKLVDVFEDHFTLKNCSLHFSKKHHAFVFNNLDLFFKLQQQSGTFLIEENKLLFKTTSNILVHVTTPEEIFILNEIWNEGCYHVNVNTSKPLVFVDVGMNVGYASLYFASLANTQHIYSFEPFTPTFLQGLQNIKLNTGLSKKITPANVGLSATDEEIEVDYSPQHRGRTGIWGTALVHEKMEAVQKEKLQLQNFSTAIREVLQKHMDSEFVFKIDCEGSEYGIFENLDTTLLKNVRCVMMEWHVRGPEVLSQVLEENGFTTMSFYPNSGKTGMIYGFK